MPEEKLNIKDIAIIGVYRGNSPVGEAPRGAIPFPPVPMTSSERLDMLQRLEDSIGQLMDEAQENHEKNCYKPGTNEVDKDYITRLSTNEFFFYTKEPLTLQEFERVQNKIAEKARALSPGVQLILGSFAVQSMGSVMNVTPHITCGAAPNFHLVVKSTTSAIDVRYKIPDGKGGASTLPALDKSRPFYPMPTIKIDGLSEEFSFNNVFSCCTPSGRSFMTAIDICLDHAVGVAKSNYSNLVKASPIVLKQPLSHVVVSNYIELYKNNCIGIDVMHADPICSPSGCKKGVTQQASLEQKQTFGNDPFIKFELVSQALENIKNTYAYKTTVLSAGRDHKSYTVTLDKVRFKKSQDTIEFQNFKGKYNVYKGDFLKSEILADLKKRIEDTTSLKELDALKKEIKTSFEYDVLKTGQGLFTKTFAVKTSSEDALEDMFEQQKTYLSSQGLKF